MTRNRHDDRFSDELPEFEFEFGDGDRGRRDAMSETVELTRSAPVRPAPPRRGPTRRLALLFAGAVALGIASFLIVNAVRGDDEGAPAAAPEQQTVQTVTSAAATTQSAASTPGATAPTPTAPATTAAGPVADALVPVSPEDEGEAVRALQEALAAVGFSAGEVDGVYGAATVAAVAAFQRSTGLVEDGVAGAQTIAALNAALGSG